jgi:peptidoglycan/xylan/chitin deacetylase (PgdA/CDA1 family)
MYHGLIKDSNNLHSWLLVKASEFEKQLRFINQYFDIISIDDLLFIEEDNKKFSKPKIIITFDDGLKNNFDVALPILEKYNCPATIYVTTQPVIKGQLLWDTYIIESVQKNRIGKIDLRDINLGVYQFDHSLPKQQLWGSINDFLSDMKKLEPGYRKSVIKIIKKQYFLNRETKSSNFSHLTPIEISKIADSELITIGSHSHCHNILTQIPVKEVEKSILKSLTLLEDWVKDEVNHFAYPNGNYNSAIKKIVENLSIRSAVTCEIGRWRKPIDLYEIPRIGVGGYDSISFFRAKVTGSADFINNAIIRNESINKKKIL